MRYLGAIVVRGLLLVVLWGALSGWSLDYALYGVASVLLTLAVSLKLSPPSGHAPSPMRSLTLAGWFIGQAVVGGVDVAKRAVARTPDIDPAVLNADLVLPPGPAAELALLLMNLMPGTMVQHVAQDRRSVELHTLSEDLDPVEQWMSLQRRVAAAARVDTPVE